MASLMQPPETGCSAHEATGEGSERRRVHSLHLSAHVSRRNVVSKVVIGRPFALDVLAESEGGRIVIANDRHIRVGLDLVFHSQTPKRRVDQHPSHTFAGKVIGGAHGGHENAPAVVGAGPGDRHHRIVAAVGDGRILRAHAGKNLALDDGVSVAREW